MPACIFYNVSLKKYFFGLLFTFFSVCVQAQLSKADSLKNLLQKEIIDSNRVRLLWQLASQVNIYNPDTAIRISQQAFYIAKKINYGEGQSRALGVLSNSLIKIGNYPRALELNIQKLQLEEKRKIPRNMASVLMNIGVIYVLQKEYAKAQNYYQQSDAVIIRYNIDNLKYFINLNLGDVFNRMDISDSAYIYFSRSLQLAEQQQDIDFKGTSLTGLGHCLLKLGKTDSSLIAYRKGIAYLVEANDDEILCEATLGLANLFKQLKQYDSAKYYAAQSYALAKKDGFLSKELEAAEFLTEHFKRINRIDSAFTYINYVKTLNDSVNSNNKIRELQVISTNEQFRQAELEEANKLEEEERRQRLQWLFIGMFIPGLFLFTLLLSRVKVNVKVVRVLSILSLLFFFEYLTILLHPAVAVLTHHTPWIEILIFVAVGALLVPAHHRLEHWLVHKLLGHRISNKPAVITVTETSKINSGVLEKNVAPATMDLPCAKLENEIKENTGNEFEEDTKPVEIIKENTTLTAQKNNG